MEIQKAIKDIGLLKRIFYGFNYIEEGFRDFIRNVVFPGLTKTKHPGEMLSMFGKVPVEIIPEKRRAIFQGCIEVLEEQVKVQVKKDSLWKEILENERGAMGFGDRIGDLEEIEKNELEI